MFKKKQIKNSKKYRKGSYLICVLVLILLVRLDLGGLPMIRLFEVSPEVKPTSSVAGDNKKQRDACRFKKGIQCQIEQKIVNI